MNINVSSGIRSVQGMQTRWCFGLVSEERREWPMTNGEKAE